MMTQAIGIDIGGTKIRAGLVSSDGTIQRLLEVPTEARLGPDHVADRVAELCRSYQDQQVEGIGIGTSGQVGQGGQIMFATSFMPGWGGYPLQTEIERRTGTTVKVVNDVQAMALGELNHGAGKHNRHFLCLALGTGVGGAIISDGKLLRGRDGLAGALGHIIIHSGGRICPCGQRGCLEAYIAGKALGEIASDQFGKNITAGEVFDLARDGDLCAAELVERWLNDVVAGLWSLASVFNPEKIILAGGLTKSSTHFFPELQSRLEQATRSYMARPFELVLSELKDNAMIIGSANLLFRRNHV